MRSVAWNRSPNKNLRLISCLFLEWSRFKFYPCSTVKVCDGRVIPISKAQAVKHRRRWELHKVHKSYRLSKRRRIWRNWYHERLLHLCSRPYQVCQKWQQRWSGCWRWRSVWFGFGCCFAVNQTAHQISLCQQRIQSLGFEVNDEGLTFRCDTVTRRGWSKSLTSFFPMLSWDTNKTKIWPKIFIKKTFITPNFSLFFDCHKVIKAV